MIMNERIKIRITLESTPCIYAWISGTVTEGFSIKIILNENATYIKDPATQLRKKFGGERSCFPEELKNICLESLRNGGYNKGIQSDYFNIAALEWLKPIPGWYEGGREIQEILKERAIEILKTSETIDFLALASVLGGIKLDY